MKKVLMLDADNLQANIFLGNYYYLQAEKDKKKLEEDYKKITSPTRMQYARYRNGLSDVFTNSYGKAKAYLQRVLQVFPSMEAGNTLEKIKKMELELKIAVRIPTNRKGLFVSYSLRSLLISSDIPKVCSRILP